MRKFVIGSFVTALLAAVVFVAMPVRDSQAHHILCYGHCYLPPKFHPPKFYFPKHHPPKAAPKPKPQQPGERGHTVGQYWLACGLGAAGAEMINSAIHHNDKNDPRQLTLFEAGWTAAVCPAMLPWALLVSATCPDNKATYAIARLARRYGLTHPAADWTPFTNAYGQACRDGTLSADFLAFLRANGLRVGNALRG